MHVICMGPCYLEQVAIIACMLFEARHALKRGTGALEACCRMNELDARIKFLGLLWQRGRELQEPLLSGAAPSLEVKLTSTALMEHPI